MTGKLLANAALPVAAAGRAAVRIVAWDNLPKPGHVGAIFASDTGAFHTEVNWDDLNASQHKALSNRLVRGERQCSVHGTFLPISGRAIRGRKVS